MKTTTTVQSENAPESLRPIAAPSAYAATLPMEQVQAGIRFLTGGAGLREAIAIKHAMHDFPLALEFRIKMNGKERFPAQVKVTIRVRGGKAVLKVPSAGPFLLARLQPGTYEIEAGHNGARLRQVVETRANGGEHLVFEWKVS